MRKKPSETSSNAETDRQHTHTSYSPLFSIYSHTHHGILGRNCHNEEFYEIKKKVSDNQTS